MTNELAGLGHNNPRPFDLVQERAEALARAAREWEAAVAEINDPDTARRADDFLSQLTAESKRVNAEKAAEKAPHFDANREVDTRYGPVALLLADAKAKIEPKIRAWLARQRAAAPDARPRVRGSYSVRARSLRQHWFAELADVIEAFSHYQDHPKIAEVLTELASADARAGVREIPGCVVKSREIAA